MGDDVSAVASAMACRGDGHSTATSAQCQMNSPLQLYGCMALSDDVSTDDVSAVASAMARRGDGHSTARDAPHKTGRDTHWV